MRVVLYTTDFEPITVLDIPVELLDQLERLGGIRIAVSGPPGFVVGGQVVESHELETVTIFCEKLKWHDGSTKTILVTPNDEISLSLRPDWLPGQTQAIQWYHRTIRELVDQLQKALRKD